MVVFDEVLRTWVCHDDPGSFDSFVNVHMHIRSPCVCKGGVTGTRELAGAAALGVLGGLLALLVVGVLGRAADTCGAQLVHYVRTTIADTWLYQLYVAFKAAVVRPLIEGLRAAWTHLLPRSAPSDARIGTEYSPLDEETGWQPAPPVQQVAVATATMPPPSTAEDTTLPVESFPTRGAPSTGLSGNDTHPDFMTESMDTFAKLKTLFFTGCLPIADVVRRRRGRRPPPPPSSATAATAATTDPFRSHACGAHVCRSLTAWSHTPTMPMTR